MTMTQDEGNSPMSEDERWITPANVTMMTIERAGRDWRVIIKQGNGDVIKMFDLTPLERLQLAAMLGTGPDRPVFDSCSFVDSSRNGAL